MPNPVAMVGRAIMAKTNASPSSAGLHSHRSHSNSSLLPSGSVTPNGRAVSNGTNSSRENAISEAFGSKDAGLVPNKHRAFLMDTQVKYTVVSERTDYYYRKNWAFLLSLNEIQN